MTGLSGPDFVYTFLLCHTYFTTTTSLIKLLEEHFFLSGHSGNDDLDQASDRKQLAKQSRLDISLKISLHPNCTLSGNWHHRIVNILKRWVENHFYFFEDNENLAALDSFISLIEAKSEKLRELASPLRVRISCPSRSIEILLSTKWI